MALYDSSRSRSELNADRSGTCQPQQWSCQLHAPSTGCSRDSKNTSWLSYNMRGLQQSGFDGSRRRRGRRTYATTLDESSFATFAATSWLLPARVAAITAAQRPPHRGASREGRRELTTAGRLAQARISRQRGGDTQRGSKRQRDITSVSWLSWRTSSRSTDALCRDAIGAASVSRFCRRLSDRSPASWALVIALHAWRADLVGCRGTKGGGGTHGIAPESAVPAPAADWPSSPAPRPHQLRKVRTTPEQHPQCMQPFPVHHSHCMPLHGRIGTCR